MTGSNQFTTEIVYMYIMLHTYIYICNTLDPNRSPCQKCSVDTWYISAGISGSQKGAQEMLHLGVHTREPGLLCQAAQRRTTRLSPQRKGRASAAFPGSAQAQQRSKRQRRRHCTPLQPATCPCARRPQETERFFARCFFTTSDGMKVFLRGRHGRSLDSALKAGPLGGAGGSGC